VLTVCLSTDARIDFDGSTYYRTLSTGRLNSMLVRLLLLILQNASKSLLMVAVLLSLYLIL
jgi:hypothetical protein